MIFLYTYMFIYNISLTVFFWSLFNAINSELKTMYSFSNLSFNSYFITIITLILLSLAGVPPFVGFFSKLFLIILLLNSSFFLLYSLLFIVLFLGLYFYLQNIRFIHSTNAGTHNSPYLINERIVINYYYFSMYTAVVITFGLVFIDDILLFFTWIFF